MGLPVHRAADRANFLKPRLFFRGSSSFFRRRVFFMPWLRKYRSRRLCGKWGCVPGKGRGMTGFIQKKSLKISLSAQYGDGDDVYIIV